MYSDELYNFIVQNLDSDYSKHVTVSKLKNRDGSLSINVTYSGSVYCNKSSTALLCKVDGNDIIFRAPKSLRVEGGFLRRPLQEFLAPRALGESSIIINSLLRSSFQFSAFGCCHRYAKCSEAGRCIHDDLLYATACMYRKNLERGRIFYNDVKEENRFAPKQVKRPLKGKSLIAFPHDYTVIDLETTGLDPEDDDIIEVAAVRVRNGEIADSFQSLVRSRDSVDEFITELTGITTEMLSTAPAPNDILPQFLDFIGDDIIVGHNVNFDINFLYDWFEWELGKSFSNDFVDTMRIARRVLPELKHHRLRDLVELFGVELDGAHRALADCRSTYACFNALQQEAIKKFDSIENFLDKIKRLKKQQSTYDISKIATSKTEFDESHPLYGKVCVFTGTLEKMTRSEAAQFVVDVGGICGNGITKKTNFLILGNNDYCKTIKDGKSSKQKKAEEYILQGLDLQILSENAFYDLIES